MRAIYLPFEKSELKDFNCITNELKLHHLINVIRIKIGEQFLLMNGRGLKLLCKVDEIFKKKIHFSILEITEMERPHKISLAYGLTKKDYSELILSNLVEMGVENIYPLDLQYSSKNKDSNLLRQEKIIENALEQSNNFFYPLIHKTQNLSQFIDSLQSFGKIIFSLIFVFHLDSGCNSVKLQEEIKYKLRSLKSNGTQLNTEHRYLVMIGPEGGFSDEEILKIKANLKNSCMINLTTPILKSVTASIASISYIMGILNFLEGEIYENQGENP